MEGSPVRGPERSLIARLCESQSLEGFQADLIRVIRGEVHEVEAFMGLFDTDSKALQIPSWVKSHMERHPALSTKLE